MTKNATASEAAATSARPAEGGKRPAERKQPTVQAGNQIPDSQQTVAGGKQQLCHMYERRATAEDLRAWRGCERGAAVSVASRQNLSITTQRGRLPHSEMIDKGVLPEFQKIPHTTHAALQH